MKKYWVVQIVSGKAEGLWEGSDKLRNESARPGAEGIAAAATYRRTLPPCRLLAPLPVPLLRPAGGCSLLAASGIVHIKFKDYGVGGNTGKSRIIFYSSGEYMIRNATHSTHMSSYSLGQGSEKTCPVKDT